MGRAGKGVLRGGRGSEGRDGIGLGWDSKRGVGGGLALEGRNEEVGKGNEGEEE